MAINLEQFKLTPKEQNAKLNQVPLDKFKLDNSQPSAPEGALGNLAVGATKGALSTVTGLGQLALKGYNAIPGLPGKNLTKEAIQTGEDFKNTGLKPLNNAQSIGKTAEQIGEFFIPTGEAGAVGKLIPKLPQIAKEGTLLDKVIKGSVNLAGKSAVSATDFAARTAAQTGGDSEEIKKAGIIGAATPPVLKGISASLSPIGKTAAAIMGQMIGKEPEHIIRAFKNPEIVAKKISEKVIPLDVREQAVSALNKFRESYQNDFATGLEKLKTFDKTYGSLIVNPEFVKGWSEDLTNTLQRAFRNFRISVLNNGKTLDFDKLNSSIVRPGERKNIQMVYDTIKNQKDFSPQGVQDVAARINALSKFTDGSKDLTSAVISKIHDEYSKFIEETHPDLGKLRSAFAAKSKIWEGLDQVLRSTKDGKMNPVVATGVTKRLSSLFNEDNEAYVRALETLEKETGVDLLNSLVASEFRNVIPRKLGSYMSQAGLIAGGFLYNPLLLAALPLFSPRLEGKVITSLGKSLPIIKTFAKNVPRTFPALIRKK